METFVVRVWRPADDGSGSHRVVTELRGTVLHPASGSEVAFTSEAELLRLLRRPPENASGVEVPPPEPAA